MSALIKTLASYVPNLIRQRLERDPTPVSGAIAEHLHGAVIFADISGFTALAERLTPRPSGAEDLAQLLNTYLGQMIDLVSSHGGDIVKFAGDALVALWPSDAAEGHARPAPPPDSAQARASGQPAATGASAGLKTATLRAAQCALALQEALHNYSVSEDVRLSLRVLIGVGEMTAMYLGGVYSRWEYLVSGEPFIQLSIADQLAQPGQVIVSPEAWEQISAESAGQPLRVGVVRLKAITTPSALPADTRGPLSGEAEGTLRGYLPGAVATRLAAGQSDWLAELRTVSVIFVNLPDLSHIRSLLQAQAMMRGLQTALYRYEGSINKLSVDDKGISLVAALGLPPLSHEDDASRAIQAAMAMQSVLKQQRLLHAIGVATGRVFCGTVGNAQRREYTMIGATVNLAARLMQAATDDIFCDHATYQAAQAQLSFEPLPPLSVKGRGEPVPIYRPLGLARTAIRPQKVLVGRRNERTLLAEELQALLRGGPGGLLLIEGEAGIGKSQLAADLRRQAESTGITAFAGGGDAVEQRTPYHVWRPVLNQLFDLDILSDLEARRRHLLDLLELEPELEPFAPLLNSVIPLELPENVLTRPLSGQARAERTRELLLQILQRSASRSPKLLILDHAQWFDSASWALALAVHQQVQPLLLVLLSRPLEQPLPAEYRALRASSQTRQLQLEPLTISKVEALLCQRLGVSAVPPRIVSFIYEKAEGNPLFSEELALALCDAGLLLVDKGGCQVTLEADELHTIQLPNTIQGMITSRIDRLTPAQQLTLKVASVIGRVFAFRTLRDIYPVDAARLQLADELGALSQMDMTVVTTPEPELTYSFKQTITQEAAYNLLPFAQRRELHRAVAEWYERSYPEDLAPFYLTLAHHWREAGLDDLALDYMAKAAEQALRGGAYHEAIRCFGETLLLAERLGVDDQRRQHWEYQLASAQGELKVESSKFKVRT